MLWFFFFVRSGIEFAGVLGFCLGLLRAVVSLHWKDSESRVGWDEWAVTLMRTILVRNANITVSVNMDVNEVGEL